MADQKQIIKEVIEEAVQAEPKNCSYQQKSNWKTCFKDEDLAELTIHVKSRIERVWVRDAQRKLFHDFGSNVTEYVQFYFPRKSVDAQRDQGSLS